MALVIAALAAAGDLRVIAAGLIPTLLLTDGVPEGCGEQACSKDCPPVGIRQRRGAALNSTS